MTKEGAGIVRKIIKRTDASDGKLFMTSAGRRRFLASFNGVVEIEEIQPLVPVLGRTQKGVKSVCASLIRGDIDFASVSGFDSVLSGRVFDASALVWNEVLNFAGLRFEDSDPANDSLTFEIADLELIRKLLITKKGGFRCKS